MVGVIVGEYTPVSVGEGVAVCVIVGEPPGVSVSVIVIVGVGGGTYSYAPISYTPSCGLEVPAMSYVTEKIFVPAFLQSAVLARLKFPPAAFMYSAASIVAPPIPCRRLLAGNPASAAWPKAL